ncbi:MAG: phosphoribosylanthranilate isomerase [Planctomycetes bacterium]|nr:phosphoribosylanthranilate isomerase [Planctomycetota bacterium]
MWTKICGIRDLPTALAVAEAGATALGLNFYAPSPRSVSPETAAAIVAGLPPAIEPVGLFVNHAVPQVEQIARHCGLRCVQLHGDETPEAVAHLSREFRVIRAFRVGDDGLHEVAQYLQQCRDLEGSPWACLIDAKVAGRYGGTGHVTPWELVKREYQWGDWPPLILAGGLNPSNVAEAIAAVNPWGVDVAGGVESAVACKDLAMVRQFVLAANLSTMH